MSPEDTPPPYMYFGKTPHYRAEYMTARKAATDQLLAEWFRRRADQDSTDEDDWSGSDSASSTLTVIEKAKAPTTSSSASEDNLPIILKMT
jgi:hypothetical protein